MGNHKDLKIFDLQKENTELKLVATRLKVIESFAAEIFTYNDLEDILCHYKKYNC